MSKITLKIYIFFLIFQPYIFQYSNKSDIQHSDQYNSNNTYYIMRKNRRGKIFQTLYSDSPSNNYYYTTLYLGRNLTKQTYLIDTDIETLSSPCKKCTFCGKNKTNYYYIKGDKKKIKYGSGICDILPALRSSNIINKKYIKPCYFLSTKINGDGIRGYFMKEEVYFETNKIPFNQSVNKVYKSYSVPIGCSRAEFGNYKNISTDGIMGLNYNNKSFANILYNLNITKKNIFSICLGNMGGYLSLGYVTRRYHTSKIIKFIELLKSDNSYKFEVNSFEVGNVRKYVIKATAILDSTNPISYFPNNIFQKMLYEFEDYCNDSKKPKCSTFYYNSEYGYCTNFENEQEMNIHVKLWPYIFFTFDTVMFFWNPKDYFYRANDTKACLGINNHSFSHITFGSNLMRNYDFIFDNENKRIGFIKADCSQIITNNNNMNNNSNININNNYFKIENEVDENNETIIKNKFPIIKDGIEFIRGRNDELNNIKDKTNIFNLIIHNVYISLLGLTIFYIIIIVVVLYRILNSNNQIFDEEANKFNQIPND